VDALAAGAAANMEYFEVEDLMEVRILKMMIDNEDMRNNYNEIMDTRWVFHLNCLYSTVLGG
jgi:hypothetical protein